MATAKKLFERSPLESMIVKHARCLDPKQFESNAVESRKLLLKRLTFLKVIPATTEDKALLQFTLIVQTSSRTESEKIQAFKRNKYRLHDFFFKDLIGVSMCKELCMVLQVVFIISHGQASAERGFRLNKNLADNMEEVSIQSRCLIKDYLLSNKLSPHSLGITCKML